MTMNNGKTVYTSDTVEEKYYYVRHKSGLAIYVVPKEFSTCYATLGVRFGSVDSTLFRPDGKCEKLPYGVAHFLEHKMFENEDGTDAMNDFASLGASSNAYTTSGYTAYLFSCSENFYESLTVLLNLVTHPHFTEENVSKERAIISEEIKMYEDKPSSKLYLSVLRSLYPHHPISENVAGTLSSIEKITPEMLLDCHENFYYPGNMVLVVCGNVDIDRVVKIADKCMPDEAREPYVRIKIPYETDVPGEKITTETDVSIPRFALALKEDVSQLSPREKMKRSIAAGMLDDIVFGKSGSLYHLLYNSGRISSSLDFEYEFGDDYAVITLSASSSDPDKATEIISEKLSELISSPPSETDFRRVKKTAYADYICSFDSTEDIAEEMIFDVMSGTDIFEVGTLIKEIDYKYLCDFIVSLFSDNAITVSEIKPKGE